MEAIFGPVVSKKLSIDRSMHKMMIDNVNAAGLHCCRLFLFRVRLVKHSVNDVVHLSTLHGEQLLSLLTLMPVSRG